MSDSRNTFSTVLFAAAAGFIAGVLLAPDKGSETRRRITNTSRKVMDIAQTGASAVNTLKQKFTKRNGDVLSETSSEEASW